MGADVQSWQDRLSHLGYTIPTSGTFDSASVQETKIFQSAQGLSPSGLVDEATWKAAFHPFAGV
ncbi:MAG: peptidoglycan-binding domain-containing protein [Candidatus Dormibacteria bacterium]